MVQSSGPDARCGAGYMTADGTTAAAVAPNGEEQAAVRESPFASCRIKLGGDSMKHVGDSIKLSGFKYQVRRLAVSSVAARGW